MIGIYKITNKVNNHCYIGKSINIAKRWREHKRNSKYKNSIKYNYPLYKAMRKYRIENFELIVLEECSEEVLTQREQYYYDLYKPKYCLLSPTQSPSNNPEVRKRISKSLTGKRLSKETIQKISNSRIG